MDQNFISVIDEPNVSRRFIDGLCAEHGLVKHRETSNIDRKHDKRTHCERLYRFISIESSSPGSTPALPMAVSVVVVANNVSTVAWAVFLIGFFLLILFGIARLAQVIRLRAKAHT